MKLLFPLSSSAARFAPHAKNAARLTAFIGVCLLGAGAGAAHADAINVDFNFDAVTDSPNYVGVGAAPDTGTVWNNFLSSTVTQSNLVNSRGVATGISATQQSAGRGNNPNGVAASGNSAAALLQDYIRTDATPLTVTLNGLTNGTRYSLYLYGAGQTVVGTAGGSNSGSFTVGGITQNTTGPVAATTNLTLGEDYVVFNNVFATNGGLTITYGPAAGETRGVFNGFQLVTAPVPEPSTWAMMALGVGALSLIARRKRSEAQDSTNLVDVAI